MKTQFEKMTGAEDGQPNNENETPVEGLPAEENDSNAGIQLANFSRTASYDSSDIVIPRLRLAQGLTSEVQDGSAKPGQWLMTGYPPADELTVIPMMFGRNRTLRDDAGGVLCKSSDSITGEGIPGGLCGQCPMNTWADGPKGERIPPACVFSYTYICYVVELSTIGLVEFRRTSIQAGKTLNTFCAQRGIGNFAVKLRNSKQQGKRGTFYQIVVQPVAVDVGEFDKARQLLG